MTKLDEVRNEPPPTYTCQSPAVTGSREDPQVLSCGKCAVCRLHSDRAHLLSLVDELTEELYRYAFAEGLRDAYSFHGTEKGSERAAEFAESHARAVLEKVEGRG